MKVTRDTKIKVSEKISEQENGLVSGLVGE